MATYLNKARKFLEIAESKGNAECVHLLDFAVHYLEQAQALRQINNQCRDAANCQAKGVRRYNKAMKILYA